MQSPLHGHKLPPRSGAFTLLELLAVIAIVGLLAALLVPAYRGVVARAQDARCLSNLRQIGTAVAAYAGEHNGAFPRGGWAGGNAIPIEPPETDGVGWLTDIYPYLDDNRNIFICPSGKKKSPTGQNAWMRMPNGKWSDPLYPMHYAYNAQLNTNRPALREPQPGAPSAWNVDRMAAVQNLSGLPVMIDIVFQNNFYGGVATVFNPDPPATANEAFAARHGGKGNILWGDGRVSSLTAAQWADAPNERIPDGGGWKRMKFCKGEY